MKCKNTTYGKIKWEEVLLTTIEMKIPKLPFISFPALLLLPFSSLFFSFLSANLIVEGMHATAPMRSPKTAELAEPERLLLESTRTNALPHA